MDEHQTSRASVGGFFTIEPFPGLIMDPVSKEAYAVDDTVTTLFDTTGGRQMEMGPQGGIQNGLEMKAGMAGPVPDEKIQGLLARIRGKPKNTLLASRPGLLSYVAQDTIRGRKVSFYLVVSSRGLVSGHVTDAPQAELDHYNRLFATALPEGAQAAEKKPDPRLETLETNLASVDRTIQALEAKLKTAMDLLEKQDLTTKQEQSIQSTWEAKIRAEKLSLDKAEKEARRTADALAGAQKELSSLGVFAFAQKKALRSRMETLTAGQALGDAAIRKLQHTIAFMKKDLENELEKVRLNSVKLDAEAWSDYVGVLKARISEYTAQKKEWESLMDAAGGGECLPDTVPPWVPEPLPAEPAPSTAEADIAAILPSVLYNVLAASPEPMTLTEIQAADPRLARVPVHTIQVALLSLGDRVRMHSEKGILRYSLF